MATTDADITLVSNTSQVISLGASTSFMIQNTKNQTLRWKIAGSSTEGGQIYPKQSAVFDASIDLWNPDGKDGKEIKVYLIRD